MQKGTQQKSTAIKVYIRVRPLVGHQIGSNQVVQVAQDGKTVNITTDTITSLTIKFDQAIPKTSNQKDFFSLFTNYIPKIPQGYNLTVFAYGQTGSGKTHTMFGSDWQYTITKNPKIKQQQNTFFQDLQSDQNYAGLIPRTIFKLFQQIKNVQQNNGKPLFNIYCSFLQIYNEKIYDLLQDFPKPKALNIHQSKLDGIFVQGLAQYAVSHYLDCLQLMKRGQKNRFIRQTSMNTKSSRSHTIFQILLQSTHQDSKGMFKKARLNLCDLAGSQKINKSQTMGADHFQQLKNINQSLSTLGKVIASLSSKTKSIAAFRESKLTRLLQQSLIGNTYTFIVGNISPSANNMDETMNTLKFVQRARHITMKIKPMEFNGQNMEIINKLQKQISYLKQLLNLKRKGMTAQDIQTKLISLQQQNEKLKKTSISFQDVQKLIQQNHRMKQQIHKLQMTQYAQSQADMQVKSQFNMTNRKDDSNYYQTASNVQTKIKKNTNDSLNNINGFEIQSLGHIVPNGTRNKQIQQNSRQRQQSYDQRDKQTYTPSQTKKSLVNVGQRLLQSHDSGMYSSHSNQVLLDTNNNLNNSNSNLNNINNLTNNNNGARKKQKQKILDKLQQLQRIQKFNQQKLMKDLQLLQRKSIQSNNNNKNSQSVTKRKSVGVIPSTAQRKITTGSTGSIGTGKNSNVNYQQKIRQLQAKLFGK